MTEIYIRRESLREATEWEVNGQSPSMSPYAVVQAVQQLLGILSNPILGPASGLQIYPLVNALIVNGALRNMKGVQSPKSEVDRRMLAQGGAGAGPPAIPGGGAPPVAAAINGGGL